MILPKEKDKDNDLWQQARIDIGLVDKLSEQGGEVSNCIDKNYYLK